MSDKDLEATYFVSFCLEQYKHAKAKSGKETIEMFDKYGITPYLYSNYEALHTQSHQWITEEIDRIIKQKEKQS